MTGAVEPGAILRWFTDHPKGLMGTGYRRVLVLTVGAKSVRMLETAALQLVIAPNDRNLIGRNGAVLAQWPRGLLSRLRERRAFLNSCGVAFSDGATREAIELLQRGGNET